MHTLLLAPDAPWAPALLTALAAAGHRVLPTADGAEAGPATLLLVDAAHLRARGAGRPGADAAVVVALAVELADAAADAAAAAALLAGGADDLVELPADAVATGDGAALAAPLLRRLPFLTTRVDARRDDEARWAVASAPGHVADGVVTIDERSTVLFANEAFARMFGWAVDALVGGPLDRVMPDYLVHLHHAAVARYAATGVRSLHSWSAVRVPGLHRDGHEFPLDVSFGEARVDGRRLFTAVLRDASEREATETRLRDEWTRLRRVVEMVHDVVFETDLEGRWTFLNGAWTALTGFPVSATLGRPFLESVHPDDRAVNVERRRALVDGEVLDVRHTVRYLTRDGGIRWVDVSVRPLRDAAGTFVGAAGTLTDITARRAAQERVALLQRATTLCATATDFRAALASLLAPLAEATQWPYAEVWLERGGALERGADWCEEAAAREAAARDAARDAAQAAEAAEPASSPAQVACAALRTASRTLRLPLGTGIPGVVHTTGEPCRVADVRDDPRVVRTPLFAAAGLHTLHAFPVRAEAGSTVAVLLFASPAPDPDDARRAELVSTVVRQIEALVRRKRAEDALVQSEARYRQLIEQASDGVYRLDPHGTFVFGSAPLERSLGLPEGALVGRSYLEFVPAAWRDRVHDLFATQIRDRVPTAYHEFPVIGAGGEERWVGQSVQLEVVDGRVRGLHGIARDITARVAAERRLAESRRQELATGAQIQELFLRGDVPTALRGLRVAAMYGPATQLDGDFVDFVVHAPPADAGRGTDGADGAPAPMLDVLIGDFIGRGVGAALLGAAVKSRFARAIGLLTAAAGGAIPSPAAIVNAVHADVAARLVANDSFASVLYARLDPARGVLRFVDCGHPRLLHWRAATGHCVFHHGDDVPIGFRDRWQYAERETALAPGDVLVLYTDGVSEARDAAGTLLGEGRLAALVAAHAPSGAEAVVEAVRGAIAAHVGLQADGDDRTCVAVQVAAAPAPRRTPAHAPHAAVAGLELPHIDGALPLLRDFVRTALGAHLDDAEGQARVERLVLAAHEAARNVAEHAYPPGAPQPLHVHVEATAAEARVRLSHEGMGWVPAAPAACPAVETLPEHGFGLFLIEELADAVHYGPDADGRHGVTLVARAHAVPPLPTSPPAGVPAVA